MFKEAAEACLALSWGMEFMAYEGSPNYKHLDSSVERLSRSLLVKMYPAKCSHALLVQESRTSSKMHQKLSSGPT